MQIRTVNVVEFFDNRLLGLVSFDKSSEEEAENWFSDCAKENGFEDEEIVAGLEDGVLEDENYCLYLVWSS